MKQYSRLYTTLLKMSFTSLLMYRTNFINNTISSILWSTTTILTMVLLTSRISTVFGWTREELLILSGMYNVLFGIVYSVFGYNFDELAWLINKGELDAWLIKPIDSQFSVSLWKIDYASLFRSIIGAGFVLYLLFLFHQQIPFLSLLLFLVLMLFGITIIYAISFALMTIIIWFTTLNNLTELLYSINGLTKYPQEMYRGQASFLFFVLFPITLVVVVPTKFLLGTATLFDIISLVVCSLLLLFLSRKFWHFALRFYTSASV